MNYDRYFRELLERESEATKVPYRSVAAHEWNPEKNDCHHNVDYWVTRHSELRAVRGWLFWGPGGDGRYNLMAHSVVDEAGALVDITPIDENTPRQALRFLRHQGSEEEFAAMKETCSQVLYPFMSFEEWRDSQQSMREEYNEF